MQFTHLNLSELSNDIEGRRKRWYKLFEPPPRRTISEFADEFRILGSAASAESGQWRTSRAEYQRGIMNAISDPTIEEIVVMSSAQTGKTEILLNSIAYYISQSPSPMLCLQPTLQMAEAFSKDRVAPMVSLSPALKGKIKDPRSRDSNNTLLHKGFPGGHLTIGASNSPAGLASRPIRVLFLDEVDRYPASAGSEGDPVNLAKARTQTFLNRKIVLTSTPTIKGISRIEQAFENSDQRFFYVPCPECNHFQRLYWKNVRWEKDQPETARYECEKCTTQWSDAQRWKSIGKGEWRASRPKSKAAGFHLSALYSPWAQMEKLAEQFLHARELPEQLKTFVNTVLGETFEDEGEGVETLGLYQRREKYSDECPEGVQVVCAGIDVQDDRLEVTFLGFNEHQECWVLDHRIVLEDPSTPHAWDSMNEHLKTQWSQGDYFQRCRVACIDSGGHFTQTVYQYTKNNKGVFPIKGIGGFGKPIVGRPSRNNQLKIRLYPIGVDTAKELIYSRLRQDAVGPGYIHFPEHLDEEYFKQLTAERVQKRLNKGFLKREFVKIYARNEALDTMVYGLAAFLMISPNLMKKKPRKKVEMPKETPKHIESFEPAKTQEDATQTQPKRKKRKVTFQKSW